MPASLLQPRENVVQFGLFLGVEVVEVAVELVEAVHGGRGLVAVTELVLAGRRRTPVPAIVRPPPG